MDRKELIVAINDSLIIALAFSLVIPVTAIMVPSQSLFGSPISHLVLLPAALFVFWRRRCAFVSVDKPNVIWLQLVMIGYCFFHPYLSQLIINLVEPGFQFARMPHEVWFIIAGPISEEAIFRGIIFERLEKSGVRYLPIAGSTILFSLWHLNNYFFGSSSLEWTLLQVLNSAFIGCIFGYLRLKTRGILAPCLAHISHNLGSFVISG